MSYEFLTIKGESEISNVIERSKFICNIKSIEDETEAKEYIEILRKRHSFANHCCYAYIADEKGLLQKFSDDGEPQGTAGLPMLEVLKNKNIFKVIAVVTRYFGGIKLGTGGLTRAYGGAVLDCLNVANITKMCEATVISFSTDYEGYARLVKTTSDKNIAVLETNFDNLVNVKIAVKNDYLDGYKTKLMNIFNGKINIAEVNSGYYHFGELCQL